MKKKQLKEEFNRIRNLINYKPNQIITEQSWFDSAYNAVSDVTNDVWNKGSEITNDVWNKGSEITNDVWNKGTEVANNVWNKGTEVANNVWNKGTEVAKDLYYQIWEDGIPCQADSSLDYKTAFYYAKKARCNNFKWKGNWYNTNTDMPIEQERKAYKDDKYPYTVIVDYFPVGQKAAGGGFGHIQSWSLNERQYQINPMPNKADIYSVLAGALHYSHDGAAMYNQKVDELNNLDKESIAIHLTKKEYDFFKKVAGEWAGQKRNEIKSLKDTKLDAASWGRHYNLLFSNCSHHTQIALLSNPDDFTANRAIEKVARGIATLPATAYFRINQKYQGRYDMRKGGIKYEKLEGVGDSVPKEYSDPKHVIKNAYTIASNKWTIVVQQTLYKQLENLKKGSTNNPTWKAAADAIQVMYDDGYVQNGNKWDKIYGPKTIDAVKKTQIAVKNGYNPVSL